MMIERACAQTLDFVSCHAKLDGILIGATRCTRDGRGSKVLGFVKE